MGSPAFTPLDRTQPRRDEALSDQVFSRIRGWIQEGKLKDGDFLPSERELAQMFDVSRVPIREALKILEFTGAAEYVRGKGLRLKRITINKLISNIDFMLIDSGHTLVDLYEARQGIELKAASLAALRWNEADMAAMEAAVAAVDKEKNGGDGLLDSSMSFHTAVVIASHNLAIYEVNLYLSDWLRIAREVVYRTITFHDAGLHDHLDILERIKARDSEGAAKRMQEHLENTWKVLAAAIAESEGKVER